MHCLLWAPVLYIQLLPTTSLRGHSDFTCPQACFLGSFRLTVEPPWSPPSTPIHHRGSSGYHPKQFSVLPIALGLWGLTMPLTDCSHRPPCCLSYCVSVCPPQTQSHHLSCRLWLLLSTLIPSPFPSSVPSTVLPQDHCTSHSP